jgi:enoyl-CoA hydratase/carnithine racemase
MVSLGEPIDSAKALALGMVNRVVPDAELMSSAFQLAEKLSNIKEEALKATKQLFHEAADLSLEEALKRGRETNKRMRAFKKA